MKKQEKKNRVFIWAVIIIFILSTFGVALISTNPNTNELPLNISNRWYKFTINENANGPRYYLKLGKDNVPFYSLPGELDSIQFSTDLQNRIRTAPYFYLTFNPSNENPGDMDYIRFDLQQIFSAQKKVIIEGMTTNSTRYPLPIVTCSNSSASMLVIDIEQANETQAVYTGNCVVIETRLNDILKVRDKLVYTLYGVI